MKLRSGTSRSPLESAPLVRFGISQQRALQGKCILGVQQGIVRSR